MACFQYRYKFLYYIFPIVSVRIKPKNRTDHFVVREKGNCSKSFFRLSAAKKIFSESSFSIVLKDRDKRLIIVVLYRVVKVIYRNGIIFCRHTRSFITFRKETTGRSTDSTTKFVTWLSNLVIGQHYWNR